MIEAIERFRMPRFNEIPNVGLYLEQTVTYINSILEPLDITITSSMLSNYVKKGYVDRPIKKQYSSKQIAYLIFIVIVKQTLSMEDIATLFQVQKKTYSTEAAYNYFCNELELKLERIFAGVPDDTIKSDLGNDQKTLSGVVIAIAHIIHLKFYIKSIRDTASE